MVSLNERYQGCLLGLAVGDAIGTTLEFKPPGSFTPIDDMVGGGPFYLQPGQWTDDTSMAICLAESLLECNGFDARDQMQRYTRWWKEGRHSSTGRCFDIGSTVANALHLFESCGEPFSGDDHPMSAGNGSLMRLAPVVRYYSEHPGLMDFVTDASRTTHGAPECIDACCYFAAIIARCIRGANKNMLMSSAGYLPQSKKVRLIATEEFLQKPITEIRGSGYVIDCLEAALWCFFHTESFDDAVLMAANLGDDADTTAAVCGQIAGAYYGVNGIRTSWLDLLHEKIFLLSLADQLYLQTTEARLSAELMS